MPFYHVSAFSRPEFVWRSHSCQGAKTSDHRELFIHASLLFLPSVLAAAIEALYAA